VKAILLGIAGAITGFSIIYLISLTGLVSSNITQPFMASCPILGGIGGFLSSWKETFLPGIPEKWDL
jgi:hypothetical protein